MVKLETATLAAGCFWCVEAVFDDLRGVEDVVSGYSGGNTDNPTYEQVCSGYTGHAEVAEIKFDPDIISFKDLLHVFFSVHDPTTLNRQGGDIGMQYRSAIFYHNEAQQRDAEEVIQEITDEGVYDNPIVTQVRPFEKFWPAEGYHQEYFLKNPVQHYCMAVVEPKVRKFRQKWADLLKSKRAD